MAFSATIGGVAFRCVNDFSITEKCESVSTTTLNVLLEAQSVPTVFQLVKLYIGGTLFFTGIAKTVSTPEWSTTYESLIFKISVSSLEYLFNQRIVNKNFYDYTYATWTDVVQYLFDNYISEENITLGEISTTSETYDGKYAVENEKLSDVLNDISSKIGNATWWVDENRVFYFRISDDFDVATVPTKLSQFKIVETTGDLRTVQTVIGASSGISATEENTSLISTIAAKTGGSGKIESVETDSDIHSDTKASTEASNMLDRYAESVKELTCICEDLTNSKRNYKWGISTTINGVSIVGDFVVVERKITYKTDTEVNIKVTLKNANYFSRSGYSIKTPIKIANEATASIQDICADSKLTPNEKLTVRVSWDKIIEERTILSDSATEHGVTTEYTAYETSFQALADYLNDGSTWTSGYPDWISDGNLTKTEDIDRETFDGYFTNYETDKTLLETAITTATADGVTGMRTITDVTTTTPDSDMVYDTTYFGIYNGGFYKWIWDSETTGYWEQVSVSRPSNPDLYYSFDELPEFPDDIDGVVATFKQDDWTTSTFYSGSSDTIKTLSDGYLVATRANSVGTIDLYKGGVSSWANQILSLEIEITIAGIIYIGENSTGSLVRHEFSVSIGINKINYLIPSETTTIWIQQPSQQIGSSFILRRLDIGDGSYLAASPVIDNSGNEIHATNSGCMAGTLFGSYAGEFVGKTTQSVEFYHGLADDQSFSLRIIIKPGAQLYQFATIVGCGGYSSPVGYGLVVRTSDTGVSYNVLLGDLDGLTSTSKSIGAIDDTADIVFTYDGTSSTYSIYLDGLLLYTGVQRITFPRDSMRIGQDEALNHAASYFVGIVDEFMIWHDVVLSENDVAYLNIYRELPKKYFRSDYQWYAVDNDGYFTPSEKLTAISNYKLLVAYADEDDNLTALPTAIASMDDGEFLEMATAAEDAGIWTPTTSATAAYTFYQAAETLRAWLWGSSSSVGPLYSTRRETTDTITAGELDALWTAYTSARTALNAASSNAVSASDSASALSDAQSFAQGLTDQLEAQTDHAILIWSTASTSDPSDDWTTDALKTAHNGDYWRQTDTEDWYRYARTGENTGSWSQITDSTTLNYLNAYWEASDAASAAAAAQSSADDAQTDATQAISDASDAQTTADSKTTIWPSYTDAVASSLSGDWFLDSADDIGYGDSVYYVCTSDSAATYTRLTPVQWGSLATAPSSGMIANDSYYNSATDIWYYYSGSAWVATSTAPITYALISNVSSLSKARSGALTPSTVTFSSTYTQSSATAAYAGRFKIYEATTEGSYSVQYTSSSNESSKVYTPTSGIVGLKCELYAAGGTSVLLQTIYVSVEYAEDVAPQYLGLALITSTSTKAFTAYTVDTDGALTEGSSYSGVIEEDWILAITDAATPGAATVYYWNGSAWTATTAQRHISAAAYDIMNLTTGGYTVANYTVIINAIIKNLMVSNQQLLSGGKIYAGSGNYNNSDTPIFLGFDSGVAKFSLGDQLYFSEGSGTFSGGLSASTGTIGTLMARFLEEDYQTFTSASDTRQDVYDYLDGITSLDDGNLHPCGGTYTTAATPYFYPVAAVGYDSGNDAYIIYYGPFGNLYTFTAYSMFTFANGDTSSVPGVSIEIGGIYDVDRKRGDMVSLSGTVPLVCCNSAGSSPNFNGSEIYAIIGDGLDNILSGSIRPASGAGSFVAGAGEYWNNSTSAWTALASVQNIVFVYIQKSGDDFYIYGYSDTISTIANRLIRVFVDISDTTTDILNHFVMAVW